VSTSIVMFEEVLRQNKRVIERLKTVSQKSLCDIEKEPVGQPTNNLQLSGHV